MRECFPGGDHPPRLRRGMRVRGPLGAAVNASKSGVAACSANGGAAGRARPVFAACCLRKSP